jgi:WXG100 family type VII secretion target
MALRTTASSGPYSGSAPSGGGNVLQTNLNAMVSASQYVHDVADMMYRQLQHLRSTLDGLQGNWDSAASKKYYQVMLTWDDKCNKLRQALYDIGDGLDHSHKIYNETELNNELGINRAANSITY